MYRMPRPRPAPLARILAAGVAVLALGACATPNALAQAAAAAAADLVMTNARIYTVDPDQPWAEAIAVKDGLIVAVGSQAALAPYQTGAQVIDAQGRLVLPAFADAHVHPVFGGMAFSRCSLHKGRSIEEYQRIIAGCVAAHPGDGVVYGVGWEDSLFPPSGIPTKDLLDQVSSDRPLIFESVGGHTFWVNSKALDVAGITADTPNPPNGEINREPTTGEPVGALQESAMALVAGQVPPPTREEIEASIIYVVELFNSLGITGLHDAGIDLAPDGTSQMMAAYKALKDQGALTLDVTLALKWDNDRGLEQIPALIAAADRAEAWGLKARTVKFYLDGVIPQQTAAMIEPYEGSEGSGTLQIEPERLTAAVTQLGAAGFQPYVHAIGDRGVRVALDAFEAAIAANGALDRPMITHMNVIHPQDQPRFGELGVIAQFQPTWSSNYPYMDLTKAAIGPERSTYIYPTGSILRGGGMVAFGADWPVATADPLSGIQVAVTRVNYEDRVTPPLLAEEAITLEQAIAAHTLNVAVANGVGDVTGSITVGKSADLIVLDQNIFELPPMDIDQTDVLVTLFRGRAVHGALDALKAPVRP
ncbi:MAG: amidohydrolase [Phenylobacterium sp.]|uniref:amidohydrolase n=1 Tax=Phenylobacterium sp. TaxID=1871053 RepID=UPI002718532B|nr:amidohydrolase [Phenylobacterium sp.]MDO8411490.1 amidohydrolase [Phenylobacterium sp.]